MKRKKKVWKSQITIISNFTAARNTHSTEWSEGEGEGISKRDNNIYEYLMISRSINQSTLQFQILTERLSKEIKIIIL